MLNPSSHQTVLSRRKKLLFSVILLVLFFGTLEGILVLAGIGESRVQADPLVGFSNQNPLLVHDPATNGTDVRVADNKLVWFNDQRFPKKKRPGSRRVFCVGGSTTYGRPYDDMTSFCGWLREFLPLADDSTQWEVINAGGISYASYRVAAVMSELVEYEPDLFIVYSGQNEFLERRTYAGIFDQPEIQRNLTAFLSKTRTFSLLNDLVRSPPQKDTVTTREIVLPGEVDEMLNHTIGPADYRRDPEWQSDVLRHYRLNLQQMITIADQAGAKILFVVPASNEKDCSPFKSEFDGDLEESQRYRLEQLREMAQQSDDPKKRLKLLREATTIDAEFADANFQVGRELFEQEDFTAAANAFQSAIDHDVCPLRATQSVQSIVRELSGRPDVMLVDFDKRLRQRCQTRYGHSILGEEYFLDHVHPTIEIHQQLALWILETLHSERWLSGEKVSPAQIEETDQRVRSKIDVAAQGIALRNLTKVLHWSGKFQEAIPCARGALDRVPDDPESLLLLADCLCRTDETNEAIVRCERLLEIDPTYASGYLVYGELLLRQEDYERAEEVLLFATVMLPPESDSLLRARYLLGVTYLMKGQFEEADRLLTEIHQIYPDDLEMLDYLAQTKAGLRETDVAIGLYEQIIGQSPNRTDTLQRLGLLFLQEGRANDAKRCFDWVIKLDPGNEQALSQRNIALQLLGGQSASRDVANGQREN